MLRIIALIAFALAGPSHAVDIEWLYVGDPGNPADVATNCFAANCGSVPYTYYVSKYEITNAQYVEFLNAKASTDPLGLYDQSMGHPSLGGIIRGGIEGSYRYAARPGFAAKPVTLSGFYNALRFANWLNNGQGDGDTETGAYTLLGGTMQPANGLSVTRNPGAITFLTSENEWYKAAYYDATSATYFHFPAGTDTQSTCAMPGPTANTANCFRVVGAPTVVGTYTGSASPYGTFDQGGNLYEWNE